MVSKALVITRNFPPVAGGMERLNFHVYRALAERFEVDVCGPAGASDYRVAGGNFIGLPLSPLAGFLIRAQWHAARLARRGRPAFVYAGSGLTAPAAYLGAKLVGAKSLCFLHGLDIVVKHPLYRAWVLPILRRFDLLLVNSRNTAALAERAGVPASRIAVLHPGVTLPDWQRRSDARSEFRVAYGIGNRPLILAAGRLTERKGLAAFISKALPRVISHVPNALLVIVGAEPEQALKHRSGVMQTIRQAVTETALEQSVVLLGGVDDRLLDDAYFAADVMVFPVLDLPGDVEGFGMVAVEAAAHGLPTVGFAVGGVPDAVAEGVSGYLMPAGDYAGLADAIVARLRLGNSEELARGAYRFAEQFSWERFDRDLLALIDERLLGPPG